MKEKFQINYVKDRFRKDSRLPRQHVRKRTLEELAAKLDEMDVSVIEDQSRAYAFSWSKMHNPIKLSEISEKDVITGYRLKATTNGNKKPNLTITLKDYEKRPRNMNWFMRAPRRVTFLWEFAINCVIDCEEEQKEIIPRLHMMLEELYKSPRPF